jgi:ribosomally synthesized peptide (two-chain TOMM family)
VGIADGGYGENFLIFGSIVMRAIALAWKNVKFREELFNDFEKDKTGVLSEYLGFNNPWNFQIIFKKWIIIPILTDSMKNMQTGFYWKKGTARRGGHGTLGCWLEDKIPFNLIQLNYPNKPRDKDSWPIALNTYNCTGPAYPFTCP